MTPKFKKNLIKWALCCASIIVLYLLLGELGTLFGVALCFVIINSFGEEG